MYRNILVPLDGSGLSECVFQHVKEIAKGNQVSDIELLYVVPPLNTFLPALSETTDKRISDEGDIFTFGTEKAVKWGTEYLSRVARDFARDGITARAVVLKGPPVEVILKYIKENAIDLVIMSTNGSSGPTNQVIGSVTDHVLRQSSVPVMIVRPQECQITV